MAREIRRTDSQGLIIGVLSELALEIIDDEIKLSNGKTKKCKRIVAKDKKFNNAISIETANGTFAFPAPSFCSSITREGEESKSFKSWETVVNEYKDKLHYGENADRVALTVSYAPQVSYNKQKDDVLVYANSFNTRYITRVDEETESSTDMSTECIIKAIRPEMRNEEETGRKIVDIMTVGYGDTDTPLIGIVSSLIIPENLIDDFENTFEIGQTCKLDFELKSIKVGGSQTHQSHGFGRKAKVNEGFSVTERVVIGGDEPYNDSDMETTQELAYTKAEIKSLLKDFEIVKKAKLEKGKENASNSNNKPRGLGHRATVETPTANDSPFDDVEIIDNEDDENPFM